MSPENDRDSQRFKLLYFATCLRRAGSLRKPYFQTEWVGMAGSDVIGYTKGGATASVKFIFISNSCRAQKCLWCSRSQSLMVLKPEQPAIAILTCLVRLVELLQTNKHSPSLFSSCSDCSSSMWTILWRKWPRPLCCEHEQVVDMTV